MIAFFPSNPNVSAAVQGYNGNLTAVDVANIRAQQAQAEAQQNAQNLAQERYFRSQQAQEQNRLASQQMANEDFFRRGQLNNSSEHDRAVMAAAAAQNGMLVDQANKDRASRELVAGMAHPADDWHKQQVAANVADWNASAEAAASRYNTLWDAEKKAQEFAIGQTQKKRGDEWFTRKSTAASEAKDALDSLQAVGFNNFLQKVGADPDANKVVWENGVAKPKKMALPSFFNGPVTTSGAPPVSGFVPGEAPPNSFFNRGVTNAPMPVTPAPAMIPPVTANRFNFVPGQGLVPLQ